jgi:RimJ/RimL family protein N-acetyltransferase
MENLREGEVLLRPFLDDDKFRMAEVANNIHISINMRDAFPHPYALSDAENFIAMCRLHDPVQIFAIEYQGLYVGNIGLVKQTDIYRKSAEIGYFLDENYWNKGIMTKAVNLICRYGFQHLDIVRINTGVFEYNIASQKVLEKCGFVKEAVFRNAMFRNGKIYDEIRYARYI